MMNRTIPTLTIALTLGALAFAASVRAEDFTMHARVSFDAGGTLIKGASDGDWANAAVNTLVLPGDVLWVENGGTMELEMAGGSFVRMADGSKMEIAALPPTATVRGWIGSFYIHRLNRGKGDFAFVAPACKVDIPADSMVRVDVVQSGGTTVSVRWGRALVRTDVGDPVSLNAGERCWVDPGLLASMPAGYDTSAEDSFDTWNRERGEVLAAGPRNIPKTVVMAEQTIGYSDLDYCGEWVYVDSRPYWRPTIVTNYVPYRNGYWSYVPGIGNTWVGNYPFSYVTSHYGRWSCTPSYGWMWSYDPVWSPAWVASVRCGDYFMWGPVGYNYAPVYGMESAYFNIGGVSFGISAMTCVPASNIYGGPGFYTPMHHNHMQYIDSHPHDINIWNIGTRPEPPVRVPYHRDSPLTVRNYAPQRSIRGPISNEDGGVTAYDRVRSLESKAPRAEFASIGRTGKEGVRTASAPAQRSADVRSLRIEKPSATAMPTHFERPKRSESDPATSTPGRDMRSSGGRDSLEARTYDGVSDTRGATPSGNSPERVMRGAPDVRGAEAVSEAPQRTPSRTAPAPDADTDSGRSGIQRRVYDGNDEGRGSARPESSGIRTAPSTTERTSPREDPGVSRTQVPESSRSVSPPPTRSRSGGKYESPEPSRSTVRTMPSSPERTTAPSSPAPSRSTVRTMPSSPERSYAPSSPAPSRSNIRTEPSPSPSRALPEPSPAPGRSIGHVPRSRDISSAPSMSEPPKYRSLESPEPRRSAPSVSIEPPSRKSFERSETSHSPSIERYAAPSREPGHSSGGGDRSSFSAPSPSRSSSGHGRR